MGRLSVVSDQPTTGAGSTVLPGVPLPDWTRAETARWSAGAPTGASPLPAAWSVLPLPDVTHDDESADEETTTESSMPTPKVLMAAPPQSVPVVAPTPELIVAEPTPELPPVLHSPLPTAAEKRAVDDNEFEETESESKSRRRMLGSLTRGRHRRLSA
jgi:hypothetical protein